jgi:hypothetical protein
MKTEEQIKRTQKSAAASFVSLSIGLWTVAVIGYLNSGVSWMTYFLNIVGALSALLSIYLILRWNWGQKQVLEFLETKQIIKIVKFLLWYTVLGVFGVGLVQTKVLWLIITGEIIVIIAAIVLYVGIWRLKKDDDKE